MRPVTRLFLLSFSCLLTLTLSAQKNFQPGYIVDHAGDTTYGLVQHKEWDFSPTIITFKKDEASREKSYRAADIRYVEVKDKQAFLGAYVRISMDQVKFNELHERDTIFRMDTIFLHELAKGKHITLYSYKDDVKERFFIKEAGFEQPVELAFKRYYIIDQVTTEYSFRSQLEAASHAFNVYSDALSQKIQRAGYERRELVPLIHLINGETTATSKKQRSQVTGIHWFAGAGVQKNFLGFHGDRLKGLHAWSVTDVKPRLSGGIDILFNKHTGRLFFRGELALWSNESTSYGSNGMNINTRNRILTEYDLKYRTISIWPQALYNLYRSRNIRIPVGIGMGYNLVAYSQNNYREIDEGTREVLVNKADHYPLGKTFFSFSTRAGIVFLSKLEASLIYQPAAINRPYDDNNMRTSHIHLQLSYLFR